MIMIKAQMHNIHVDKTSLICNSVDCIILTTERFWKHYTDGKILLLWLDSIKIYVLTQAQSALSGLSWDDTPSYRNVLYPAGAVQLLESMAIALDRGLVQLCKHLSKNMNYTTEQ